VSAEKTPHQTWPKAGAPKHKQDLDQERQALRRLIDTFRREPGSGDDSGFYRNIGRLIARPMMKPDWPGDKKH
jgi:hypothetical protein